MRIQSPKFNVQSCLALTALGLSLGFTACAQTNSSNYAIDLATALRLAGAQNLDVQLAQEKVVEAQANHESARMQFFPWISPGISYRRHDNRIQDVSGNIIDVNKQSYTAGATLSGQWELGETWYKALVAKQLVAAAGHGLDVQRQESVSSAAQGYFDLLKAQAAIGVAQEALRVSRNYAGQLKSAVEAGIAFKGDSLRVQVQAERNQLLVRQAQEQVRLASARLAQTLHLDAMVQLQPAEGELSPLGLFSANTALDSLVAQALNSRPELKQTDALAAAARKSKDGAVIGPLVPSVNGSAFVGGLGGGVNSSFGNFGGSEDYFLGLSWRIGPGGIFDRSRIQAGESRLATALLNAEKTRDEIIRQVVEHHVRWQSLADQLATLKRALAAAEEGFRLTRERKEYAVGVVLENIQAEQELTRVRNEYLAAVADLNKAQYALARAVGRVAP